MVKTLMKYFYILILQASQSRDKLILKMLPGLNIYLPTEDFNWFQSEELAAAEMAPIFQNAHLDYAIEVHHLPKGVRLIII